jgi:hypothetical protein
LSPIFPTHHSGGRLKPTVVVMKASAWLTLARLMKIWKKWRE